MPNTDELKSRLTKLGFNYLADNFADFCAQNQKKNRSIYEIIEQIASLETEEKLRRGILRRVTSANLGRFRALSEYDWNWPKKINRETVEDSMTLNFLSEPANAIIFGSSGVGKTMIAKTLHIKLLYQVTQHSSSMPPRC